MQKYRIDEHIEKKAEELGIGKVDLIDKIAKKTNRNRATIYRWIGINEHDESSLPTDRLKELAMILEVDWKDLVN